MKTCIQTSTADIKGFSLVEVALALSIAALGITSMLGLLPQALDDVRIAGETTAASRISQHIISTLDQAATSEQRHYFDANALPVDIDGNRVNDIIFVAEVSAPSGDVRLPGESIDNDTFLRRFTIKLKQTTDTGFDFISAARGSYKVNSHIFVKTRT